MYIIRFKDSNLVKFVFKEEPIITNEYVQVGNMVITDLNSNIVESLSVDAVPEDWKPEKYFYTDTDGWELNTDYVEPSPVEESTTETNDNSLESAKNVYLNSLDSFFTNFIKTNYSEIKQRSDLLDVEYHKSVLLSMNDNYTANGLNKEAVDYSQKILQGEITLDEAISSKPEQEQVHWGQFIKSMVRNMWYNKNKEIYRQLKKQILEASSFDELTQIRWSKDDFLPFPVF